MKKRIKKKINNLFVNIWMWCLVLGALWGFLAMSFTFVNFGYKFFYKPKPKPTTLLQTQENGIKSDNGGQQYKCSEIKIN